MRSCESLSLTIDQQSVLTNISCTIRCGEIVVVCGDHESGKTALLHALAGDIQACRSQVRHQGQALVGIPAQVVLTQRPATPTDQTVSDVIGALDQVTEFEIDGLSSARSERYREASAVGLSSRRPGPRFAKRTTNLFCSWTSHCRPGSAQTCADPRFDSTIQIRGYGRVDCTQ